MVEDNDEKIREDLLNDGQEDDKKVKEPSVGYGMEYTYADYMKFEFEEMVELIRGKIFKVSPAPRSYHQEISGNLFLFFGGFFKHHNCKVYHAPFDVVLPIKHKTKDRSTTVVQPDICVICDLSKIDEAGCFGAPDLVIEVISKSTSKKDMNDKYSVYEESGVREYWIVFPKDEVINRYVLEDRKFQYKGAFSKGEIASPTIFPELKFEVDEVFPID